jgi:hypothetical protein
MSVIGSNILAGASGNQGGAYNIDRSLRFRSSASAYLSRTPASAGNRKTWTWSSWVKRGTLATRQCLLQIETASNDNQVFAIELRSADAFGISAYSQMWRESTQVLRDPSAWYHLMVVVDTTLATANDRLKMYVNGSQITSFSTINNPSQNADLGVNQAGSHAIGRNNNNSLYFDGYLAETHFIDGQALTPSSFGETSTTTGVWIPKAYTGSYGTNGFYLDFEDTSSVAALGYDAAGSNDWTVNNVSLTSGATYDSMTDVPTLTSATAANYATFNPLVNSPNPNGTITNGNLLYTGTGVGTSTYATMAVTSGKFYFETTMQGIPASPTAFIGVAPYVYSVSLLRAYRYDTGEYFNGTAWAAYGATFTTNDVIGCALDMDSQTIEFFKNGASQGQKTSIGLSGQTVAPFLFINVSPGAFSTNFGQQPFAHTPPSGFVALNTFNLPTPTIGATASTQANKYFDAKLYTGTGSSLNVTGYGFSPDFVWIKERSGAADHALYDAVRGVQIQLESNTTTAETTETTGLTALNSDGFTVGALAQVNTNTDTYVAWAWDANGAGSSNTDGTITSTVSANTSAGFSIVTYTGTGSAATIGHGLGVAPSMVIVKSRSNAAGWNVRHISIPATDYIFLNLTDAKGTDSTVWNSTSPTSTVFSIGTNANINVNTNTYVAYCWSEVAGYSAFGSYTGNGSASGPFIYTGFKPKYIMVKKSSASGDDWQILDAGRNTYNPLGGFLQADLSNSETSADAILFLSNGFSCINTASSLNASGATYIYMAFAESPFKYANAR